MPKLKVTLEKLDELPAELHEFYTERDGKYFVDLDGVDEHPEVAGLRSTLEKYKTGRREMLDELKQLKDRLAKIPEDFDPEQYSALKAKLEEYEADPAKRQPPDQKAAAEAVQARRLLEEKIKSMEKAHSQEIEKREKLIKQKDDFISRLLIDEGLTKALIEVGVDRPFLKAAKAYLSKDVKVMEEDGVYQAVVETDTGTLAVDRYVADWASSDEGKAFLPPAKGSDAGGAPSGSGGNKGGSKVLQSKDKNPWTKEHWNLTEQGRIVRQDRVLADRLAKAAGKTIPAAT